jgi:hypothetical protein
MARVWALRGKSTVGCRQGGGDTAGMGQPWGVVVAEVLQWTIRHSPEGHLGSEKSGPVAGGLGAVGLPACEAPEEGLDRLSG